MNLYSISIMQVTQQRQGRGAAWQLVGCLFRGDHLLRRSLPWFEVHSKLSIYYIIQIVHEVAGNADDLVKTDGLAQSVGAFGLRFFCL